MCNISEFVLRNKVNKTPIATLFSMQLQMVVLVGCKHGLLKLQYAHSLFNLCAHLICNPRKTGLNLICILLLATSQATSVCIPNYVVALKWLIIPTTQAVGAHLSYTGFFDFFPTYINSIPSVPNCRLLWFFYT